MPTVTASTNLIDTLGVMHSEIHTIIPLITRVNSPKVSIIMGSDNIVTIGLTILFIIVNIRPANINVEIVYLLAKLNKYIKNPSIILFTNQRNTKK